MDAKHGRLYYSNMGTTHVSNKLYTWHRIETIKFDGTGLRTVVTRAEKPRALWIDTDNKYVTSVAINITRWQHMYAHNDQESF